MAMRWFAAMVVALAVVGGCGKSDAPKAAKPKIAGINFQEDQFFRLVLFGMREGAKQADVQLLEANSNNRPEKEIELVNTYVARKVDAIVISPLSAKGSVAALKLARDKGIVVVTHNTQVAEDVYTAHVECSAADLGAQSGAAARKYIETKLGGKAKVAIVAFKSQVPEQSEARTNGFKGEVTKLPGVQIVAEQDAWLPEMAVKKVGDILTAQPDVDVIWAANEGGTVGAVMAVRNAGKAGKVAVFGTDCSEQLLGMLQSPDNVLQAITAQRPVDMGRMAVEFAAKAARKEPVEKVVSMKGVLLSRENADGVKAFEKQFKEWVAKG